MAKIKYELYEGSDGSLCLYILGRDGNPMEVYDGWEGAPEPGIMLDVVARLEKGIKPSIIYKDFCCDIALAYRESCKSGEIIAHNGWVQRGALMEAAGRRAFGYPEW